MMKHYYATFIQAHRENSINFNRFATCILIKFSTCTSLYVCIQILCTISFLHSGFFIPLVSLQILCGRSVDAVEGLPLSFSHGFSMALQTIYSCGVSTQWSVCSTWATFFPTAGQHSLTESYMLLHTHLSLSLTFSFFILKYLIFQYLTLTICFTIAQTQN